jgi:hypothetical protein
MVEAVSFSEISLNFYESLRRDYPEDSRIEKPSYHIFIREIKIIKEMAFM